MSSALKPAVVLCIDTPIGLSVIRDLGATLVRWVCRRATQGILHSRYALTAIIDCWCQPWPKAGEP